MSGIRDTDRLYLIFLFGEWREWTCFTREWWYMFPIHLQLNLTSPEAFFRFSGENDWRWAKMQYACVAFPSLQSLKCCSAYCRASIWSVNEVFTLPCVTINLPGHMNPYLTSDLPVNAALRRSRDVISAGSPGFGLFWFVFLFLCGLQGNCHGHLYSPIPSWKYSDPLLNKIVSLFGNWD